MAILSQRARERPCAARWRLYPREPLGAPAWPNCHFIPESPCDCHMILERPWTPLFPCPGAVDTLHNVGRGSIEGRSQHARLSAHSNISNLFQSVDEGHWCWFLWHPFSIRVGPMLDRAATDFSAHSNISNLFQSIDEGHWCWFLWHPFSIRLTTLFWHPFWSRAPVFWSRFGPASRFDIRSWRSFWSRSPVFWSRSPCAPVRGPVDIPESLWILPDSRFIPESLWAPLRSPMAASSEKPQVAPAWPNRRILPESPCEPLLSCRASDTPVPLARCSQQLAQCPAWQHRKPLATCSSPCAFDCIESVSVYRRSALVLVPLASVLDSCRSHAGSRCS